MLFPTRLELCLIGLLLAAVAANAALRAYGQAQPPPALLVARAQPAGSAGPAAVSGEAPAGEQAVRSGIDAGSEPAGAGAGAGPGAEAQPGAGQQAPIDLNSASREALLTLPGVGPVIADRILELRAEVGRFADVRDLLRVKGIGEKRLTQLMPYLTVGAAPAAQATDGAPAAGNVSEGAPPADDAPGRASPAAALPAAPE